MAEAKTSPSGAWSVTPSRLHWAVLAGATAESRSANGSPPAPASAPFDTAADAAEPAESPATGCPGPIVYGTYGCSPWQPWHPALAASPPATTIADTRGQR